MKQTLVALGLLLISVIGATAQNKKNITVSGRLTDSLQKLQLSNATVSLVNAADSSLVAFTRTDSDGNFSFNQLHAGNYLLSASHVNFHSLWKSFQAVTLPVELGTIYMMDKSILQELTVVAQRPPVVLNGDTLEFNAESFKTKPNAVVEDMLKKMPGVEVDKDGTIRVNGKRINRVMVNGRDFFNGDPKMATRNLAADAIDKVQVFDKLSDQAAFTGVDDGSSEKTINLKLKKDKKNATFGKIGAAGGNDGRFDGQFNVNRFNEQQQLSAIGMANNTNRQGFSIMDMLNFSGQSRRMMGGGGGAMIINNDGPDEFGLPVAGINNQQGITQTIAGGFNFNDSWRKNTDMNASYFYNNLTLDNNRTVIRQNLVPGNNFNWLQNSNSTNKTQSNRFNFSADYKIDTFNSIKLTSLIGYQKGTNASHNNYESFVPGGKTLNSGFSNSGNKTEGYITNDNLLFRHKFKKKSRTLSVNATLQYNDSKANGMQNAISNFFSNGTIFQRDTLNQITKLNSITQNYSTTVSYTEPMSKRSLLEIRGFYTTNKGELDRKIFDYNKANGKHDVMNTVLSNAFESQYNYTGGGFSMRAQQKKYGYSVGTNLQYAQLNSHLKDSNFRVKQNFTNLLPIANFTYNFSRMKSLRLDYNTSTVQPAANQLQPVKDVSDPLNIREGNATLRQSYTHSVAMQFFNTNPSKQKNLFAFFNYTATENAIVNSDVITSNGARTTKPVNVNGVYNINGNVERGFRVKKLNTRFGFGVNVNYTQSVNFINAQKNKTNNLAMAPRVSADYAYKEMIDISFEARLIYNQAKYSLQPSLNNNYWRQVYDLEATINLSRGFSVSNQFTYSLYAGRSNGYNPNVALWNASLGKQVLKSKKGEVSVSAFDLLNQNIGVDRNANSNYVEDIRYKTLQRYFTLGFTYSLLKSTGGGPKAVIRTF